jgi:hypothetical protein
MAEHDEHHFVPQHYFRLFNGGRDYICVWLPHRRTLVRRASVSGQCKRHKLYGSAEIDKAFSQLEGRHAAALKTLVHAAATSNPDALTWDDYSWLLHAIQFQRARTLMEVEKHAPALEAMQLELFKAHLIGTLPSEEAREMLGHIERGEVRLNEDPTSAVFRQIATAMKLAPLLSDLRPLLIRNHTDYPFVFSDSPVVFYNVYLRQVADQGVLGIQSPGLMIFYPLTPQLQLLMLDPTPYTIPLSRGLFCDITERADVSQINALQLYHSRHAIYFADASDAPYVQELCNAHSTTAVRPQTQFKMRRDLLVDGQRPDREIMHTFEPQVNYPLSLSFVSCVQMRQKDYKWRARSPDLMEEHERRFP